jgi:hypothetical protein
MATKRKAPRRKAKARTYVGYIEYKFTKADITAIIKDTAKVESRKLENQVDTYVRTIRTLQRKVEKLEIQMAKVEIKTKK